MTSVFFEKPFLLLFFAAAAGLHILFVKMQKSKKAKYFALLNIAFHSAALCVLLICGASNEDALLFVLFSLFLVLSVSVRRTEPKANNEKNESENGNESIGVNKEKREDSGK